MFAPPLCTRRPAFAAPAVVVPAFDVFSLFDKERALKLIESRFDEVAAKVEKTSGIPPVTLRVLYGLYQQATRGDATGRGPGVFGNKEKWREWGACAGMPKPEAMQKYIKIAMAYIQNLEQ